MSDKLTLADQLADRFADVKLTQSTPFKTIDANDLRLILAAVEVLREAEVEIAKLKLRLLIAEKQHPAFGSGSR